MQSDPRGGYTTSILYRTAALHFKNKPSPATTNPTNPTPNSTPEPIAFQITFLRRTSLGRAILTVQEIKLGARLSTIHITLSQPSDNDNPKKSGGELKVKLVAYITVSPPDAESGLAITGPWSLSPAAPAGSLPDGSVDFRRLSETGNDGSWTRIPTPPKQLAAAQHIALYGPKEAFRRNWTLEDRVNQVVDQWGQFGPGGKPVKWSNEAVVYLLILFPAALNRLGAMEELRLKSLETDIGSSRDGQGQGQQTEEGKRKGNLGIELSGRFWYPIVTMNIDLKRRIPEEGVDWIHSRVVTRVVRGGRGDLDVVLLDEQGEVAATSAQVALVVDSARTTKGRGGGKL
ncbi:thioesterase-like superfamily-domain-containing protein [Aspergillus crustosus]